jgi:uncharacterized repeat protein (TIGR01451 family)
VVPTNAVLGSSGPSPIDFGDFLGIKVTGQVFNDANVNGVNDAEAGVPGAIVTADGDSFATGSSGVYTLYVTVSDSSPITVSETDPAGYLSTDAVPGSGVSKVDANTLQIGGPISGVVYYGDFGDVWAGAVITISGQVWNDNGAGGGELANGLRDGTEPGLAGAIVSLSSGLTQTTTSDGLFSRYAPPGQVITVTESNPTNYLSTDAIPGNVFTTKWDKDTLIVSALSGGSISANNLFGDVLASEVMADIIVVKEANVSTALMGETITYTYWVTNTGNVTLDPVTLSDDLLDLISLGSSSLAAGAGTSGTDTYVVQESDLPGPIINTATVTGTPPVGSDVTDTDSESVALTSNPDIEVVKEASVDTAMLGETITYTYWVTNTGNVTLNPVTLYDDRVGLITLGSTSLVQGAGTSGTYFYVVQESDLPGPIINTATVTGTPPVGSDVTDTDSESVAFRIIYLPVILKNH